MNANAFEIETMDDGSFVDVSKAVKERRGRTSPRTKAFNEVLNLLSNQDDVINLQELKVKVESLRDRKLNANNDNDGEGGENVNNNTNKPGHPGLHYVGVDALTGDRVHFQATSTPTKVIDGDRYTTVYRFRTRKGAEYVVQNGIRETDMKVF